MINDLLKYVPILILTLVLVIIIPIMEHPKASFQVVNLGLSLALIIQTVILISENIPQLGFLEIFRPTKEGAWIIGDIILIIFLLIHIFNKNSILNSVSNELIAPLFLLLVISSLILLESENIFNISMAFIVLLNSIYYLFFMGDYKKDPKYMKEFRDMVGFSVFLLVLLTAILGFLAFSYNLTNLAITFSSIQSLQEYLTYFAYFIAIILLPGFGILISRQIRRNFGDLAPFVIELISIVVFPTINLVNFRILTTFISFNHELGYIFLGISVLTTIFAIFEIIYEFKKGDSQKRTKIAKIFSLLSITDNIGFILILAGYYFSAQAKSLFFTSAIWFFLVIILIKAMIIAIISPYLSVLDKNYGVKDISSKSWGWNFLLLVLLPVIFLYEKAPGYQFISSFYTSLSNTAANLIPQSIDLIFLWVILIMGLGLITFEMFIAVWFYNSIRLELSSKKQADEKNEYPQLVFYKGYVLIIILLLFALWIIFEPKLDFISKLQTFFFF